MICKGLRTVKHSYARQMKEDQGSQSYCLKSKWEEKAGKIDWGQIMGAWVFWILS